MRIRVFGCGVPTARINVFKIKAPHSKGQTLRQLRPANSSLHSHLLCRDGKPTCLKPFLYFIFLSLPMNPISPSRLVSSLSFTNYRGPNTPSRTLSL
ncbi:hypothetical protein AMTRI_Chr04g181990 [Amborella trichopoda]